MNSRRFSSSRFFELWVLSKSFIQLKEGILYSPMFGPLDFLLLAVHEEPAQHLAVLEEVPEVPLWTDPPQLLLPFLRMYGCKKHTEISAVMKKVSVPESCPRSSPWPAPRTPPYFQCQWFWNQNLKKVLNIINSKQNQLFKPDLERYPLKPSVLIDLCLFISKLIKPQSAALNNPCFDNTKTQKVDKVMHRSREKKPYLTSVFKRKMAISYEIFILKNSWYYGCQNCKIYW